MFSGANPSTNPQDLRYHGAGQTYTLEVNRTRAFLQGMNNNLSVEENNGTIEVSGMNNSVVVHNNNGTVICSGSNNKVAVINYGPNGKIIIDQATSVCVVQGVIAPQPVNEPNSSPGRRRAPNEPTQFENAFPQIQNVFPLSVAQSKLIVMQT